MTAEIAIVNKTSIALAADSAVTMSTQKGAKTYFANKLFMLSKFHPVGIMVYGNSEFMGVPWESIIKVYRKKLGDKSFNSLEGYSDHFLNFLKRDKNLFPENQQNLFFEMFLGIAFK